MAVGVLLAVAVGQGVVVVVVMVMMRRATAVVTATAVATGVAAVVASRLSVSVRLMRRSSESIRRVIRRLGVTMARGPRASTVIVIGRATAAAVVAATAVRVTLA